MSSNTNCGHTFMVIDWTVLVVDDDILVRLDLADYLADHGFHVIEAGNADEAIQALRSESAISAVVTDVNMPGSMSGWGLARWIKREAPLIPTIVTSGVTDYKDMDAVGLEACAFVPKPYRPDVVERLVRDVVGIAH